jgi:hypothetical protein
MAKPKLRKDAALHYAKAHGIEVDGESTNKEIVAAIREFVEGELRGRREDDKWRCPVKDDDDNPLPGCDSYILDDDTYCWFCGFDVSEDGTGGFDKVAEAAGDPEPVDEPDEDDEEEHEEGADEDEEEDEEEDDGGMTLEQRTARIRELDGNTGVSAWDIGWEIHRVHVKEQWMEGRKFKTFEEYCNKALGMSRNMAYGYMRVIKTFTRDEITGVGVFNLLQLAKVTDKKEAKKLLKAAAKGMTREETKERVSELRNEGKTKKGKSPGRPAKAKSLFTRSPVGTTFKGKWQDKSRTHSVVADPVLGPGIAIEVKVLKNGVRVEFIELEDDDE